MRIDFHTHPGYAHDLDGMREQVPGIVREADRHAIDYICTCSLADWSANPAPEAIRRGNDGVLALMSDYPGRILGFCYVNPRYPDEALAEIDRCVLQGGMAGIKLWIACKASDPLMDPMADRAAELGVPILNHAAYLHRSQGAPPNTPADVAVLASRHPDANIVMAHCGPCQERGLSEIAPYGNVSIDLAGYEPEAGWTDLAVKWLGPERVIFGTDTPIRSYGMTLGKVLGARISARARRLILGENAKRLLRRRLG